jgi:hypothetical protein
MNKTLNTQWPSQSQRDSSLFIYYQGCRSTYKLTDYVYGLIREQPYMTVTLSNGKPLPSFIQYNKTDVSLQVFTYNYQLFKG